MFINLLSILIIILLKLPNLNLTLIDSKLFTSHSLLKIVIGLIVVGAFLLKKIQAKTGFYFWIFYLLSQLLSIIHASDIEFFIKEAQNIVGHVLILFFGYLIAKRISKESFIKFLWWFGVFLLIIEMSYLLSQGAILSFFRKIIQEDFFAMLFVDLNRGRYSLYLHSELFLPVYFSNLLNSIHNRNKKNVIVNCILILLISTTSLFSLYRSRLLQLIFGLVVCMILLVKSKWIIFSKKNVLIIGALLIVVFGLITQVLNSKSNIFDRLTIQKNTEAENTLQTRLGAFYNSFDIFIKSPFFGVGLGNYYYYNTSRHHQPQNKYYQTINQGNLTDPHFIISKLIAETGLVGLFGYFALIYYFIKNDLLQLKIHYINPIIQLIIASWIIYVFGIFNPFSNIYVSSWFWLLRGLIEGYSKPVTK